MTQKGAKREVLKKFVMTSFIICGLNFLITAIRAMIMIWTEHVDLADTGYLRNVYSIFVGKTWQEGSTPDTSA
jgi:hypothetical protein